MTNLLIGSWDLVEWTTMLEDGTTLFPFGDDAIGRIDYDVSGNMAVQVMKKNRQPFESEDPLQGQPDEIAKAFEGFISYCGTYEVDEASGQIIHHIKISSFPNWIGQDQIRKFNFEEDRLTLSTDLIGSKRHRLVWRKKE